MKLPKVKLKFPWGLATVIMMVGATASGIWFSLHGDKTAAVLGWVYFLLFFGMFYTHFKQNQRLTKQLTERDNTIFFLLLRSVVGKERKK